MSHALIKKGLFALLMTSILFRETLSMLGSQGIFDQTIYETNCESFALVAPALFLLWFLRRFLPHRIHHTLHGSGTPPALDT